METFMNNPLVLPNDNAKFLHDGFGSSLGTSQYYRHIFGALYTDGIKEMANSLKCWWLIDKISIMSVMFFMKNHENYTLIWRLCALDTKATVKSAQQAFYEWVEFKMRCWKEKE